MNLEELSEYLNLSLTNSQITQLQRYISELLRWNKTANLTSAEDEHQIIDKHLFSSFTFLQARDLAQELKIVDVGAGAGFPGIPLKIYNPRLNLTLIEASQRKVHFLNHIIRTLELDNARVINERAEICGKDEEHREKYDLALARALAPLAIMSEYCLPLVKIGGEVVALKGTDPMNEVAEATNAISILGGEIKDIKTVISPTSLKKDNLIIIKKIKPTPGKYPRRVGIPKKRPLR